MRPAAHDDADRALLFLLQCIQLFPEQLQICELGRTIRIDEEDPLPAGVHDPMLDRAALHAIRLEPHDADFILGMGAGVLERQVGGTVRRPVVHDDYLERTAGFEGVEVLERFVEHGHQTRSLVVRRYNDGERTACWVPE